MENERTWIRVAGQLTYVDAAKYLVDIRKYEYELAQSATPYKVRAMRTAGLKEHREAREAAIFCFGMSCRLGTKVRFALHEAQDFDFIARWKHDEYEHFTPVQLKELVPQELNANTSLTEIVEGLRKRYPTSPDLTVAIHLNRQITFDPDTLRDLNLKLGGLWIFGGISPDQRRWGLWGDFLSEPTVTQFQYPEA